MEKNFDLPVHCPLFAGIESGQLSAMLGCLGAARRRCLRGEMILAEGDAAGSLGIILQGSAEVVREDYYGNRSIMTRLGKGDMFAEAFACAGIAEMPVSVVALEESEVLLIDAKCIMSPCCNACGFHNQLIYNLMRILATKNLLCNQKIEVTSKRSTREKLMTYLMIQAKHAGSSTFSIPFDRQSLADYLEVERSGLSAEISKLRKEGVLECEKNNFTILHEAYAD